MAFRCPLRPCADETNRLRGSAGVVATGFRRERRVASCELLVTTVTDENKELVKSVKENTWPWRQVDPVGDDASSGGWC